MHRPHTRELRKNESERNGNPAVDWIRPQEPMSNVLSVGDILEVSCERGVGYASYGGKHSWLGDALWVVPEVFQAPRSDWNNLFNGPGYHIFYATHAALRQKLVKKVGYAIEALHPRAVSRPHRCEQGWK